jgi:hypothetical protein
MEEQGARLRYLRYLVNLQTDHMEKKELALLIKGFDENMSNLEQQSDVSGANLWTGY